MQFLQNFTVSRGNIEQMSETLIEQAITATQQQIERANNAQWDELIAAEPVRQQGIQQLANVDHSADPQASANALKQLLELNQVLEALCLSQRGELVDLIKGIGQGNKAKKAYQGQ